MINSYVLENGSTVCSPSIIPLADDYSYEIDFSVTSRIDSPWIILQYLQMYKYACKEIVCNALKWTCHCRHWLWTMKVNVALCSELYPCWCLRLIRQQHIPCSRTKHSFWWKSPFYVIFSVYPSIMIIVIFCFVSFRAVV